MDAAGKAVEPFKDRKRLRLLHYESYSGEDFVRKWTSILAAGPTVNLRPVREPTAIAVRALIGKGLSEEEAAPYLTQDLRAHHRGRPRDPARPRGWSRRSTRAPGATSRRRCPTRTASRSTTVLEGLRGQPKLPFHPGQPAAEARKILAAATGQRPVRAARSFLRRS